MFTHLIQEAKGGNVNFNNTRLDELMRHARDCAAIGRPDLASRYLHQAVSYGIEIGMRVPHNVRGEIISQARRIEPEIGSEQAGLDAYFLERR